MYCIDGNNMAPIIVMDGKAGGDGLDGMDVSMAETDVDPMDGSLTGGKEPGEDMLVSEGSARTDVLTNIIYSRRAKKRQQLNLAKKMAEMGCHNSSDHTSKLAFCL